ncbi:MAG: cupin domain-containing protein [Oscillospiraceae bacterium]
MAIKIVTKEEMVPLYHNGFAQIELLPKSFSGVSNYKCYLKKGQTVTPQKYPDKSVVYCFTSGTGYVTTDNWARNITELSFFVPNFDKGNFSVYAATDMEFLCLVLDMSEEDFVSYNECHTTLPIFTSFSECREYTQDCKGPHTRSWQVLSKGEVGRNLLGVVMAKGEGTVEKGHPAVDQWNYGLDNADFTLTVDGESIPHHAGDWSFVPAGLDHSLTAEPDKQVAYIWFERFVKGFKE